MRPGGNSGVPGDDGVKAGGNKKYKIIGIAAAAAAAVVVIVVAVLVGTKLFGKSYEKIATSFVTALYEQDAEEILSLVPDEVLEYMEEENDIDSEMLIDNLEESMEEAMGDIFKYDEDFELLSCEVTGDSDIKGSSLGLVRDKYDDIDIDISAAKKVKVKVKIDYLDEESKKTISVPLIKVGRKWYLDGLNMSSMKSYYDF